MLGIVLAVLCAICIAVSQVFLRKSYTSFPPSVAFFFDAIFGLLIWAPLALVMGISGAVNWWEALTFAIISAILSEAIVFYALSHGELAVTATVLATYPVYTVFFSWVLNGEILSSTLYLFVALAIVGSVIASLPERLSGVDAKHRAALVWPFVAAVCIGLSDTLSKGYINRSEDFSFLFMLAFVQIPVAIAYLRIERQNMSEALSGVIQRFSDYRYALLGGLFNIIGTGFLWLSFSFAPASIASPITGTSGALTVLLSRFAFREVLSSWKYVGIALAFVGVIGITLLRAQ